MSWTARRSQAARCQPTDSDQLPDMQLPIVLALQGCTQPRRIKAPYHTVDLEMATHTKSLRHTRSDHRRRPNRNCNLQKALSRSASHDVGPTLVSAARTVGRFPETGEPWNWASGALRLATRLVRIRAIALPCDLHPSSSNVNQANTGRNQYRHRLHCGSST